MGFRNPFRITLDKNDVAYITDYSPDRRSRPVPWAGRHRPLMVVREPANYGWPLCYKTDLPYYRWDFNTTAPLRRGSAQMHECDNPPRSAERLAVGRERRADGGARSRVGPPITNPEMWYSFRDNNPPNGLQRHAVLR